jgi:RNA polymerase sigma-70 factor (ECF subfamily)
MSPSEACMISSMTGPKHSCPDGRAPVAAKITSTDWILLYLDMAPGLRRLAVRITGSDDDADDVVQDVFIRLQARPKNTLDHMRPGYLYRLTRNLSLKLIRADQTARRCLEHYAERTPTTTAPLNDGAHVTTVMEVLQRAMDGLDAPARETFLLLKEDGLTYCRAATRLGVSQRVIERRMSRALARLRESVLGQLETAGCPGK